MSISQGINYPAGPLTNVWLHSGYEISEGKWGKTIRYADLPGLAAAILCAVINKAGRLSGSEIAYLRRKLDLSQAQCADLIRVEEQTLSLWERGKHSIPVATDAILRRICIDELGKSFPKKTRHPTTISLIHLASPINVGAYVCTHGDNVWTVCFDSIQPEPLIIRPSTSADFVTWAPDLTSFQKLKPLFAVSQVVSQTPVMNIGARPAQGAISAMKYFEGFPGVAGEDYLVNPVTGAWLSTSNTATSKEFLYETEP